MLELRDRMGEMYVVENMQVSNTLISLGGGGPHRMRNGHVTCLCRVAG